jgi:hypothetical protein
MPPFLSVSILINFINFHSIVDFDDMRELIGDEETNQLESVVVANMGDVDRLSDAFRGCHAIFHTSSFVDPHGISGYSVSFYSIYAASLCKLCCTYPSL